MIRSEGIIELVHEIRRVYKRADLCSYDVTGFVMDCGDGDVVNCDIFKLREVFTEYEANEVRDKILELTELIVDLVEAKNEGKVDKIGVMRKQESVKINL
jgi:kynureninase